MVPKIPILTKYGLRFFGLFSGSFLVPEVNLEPIKQRDSSACAPTCIEMVLSYFDVPHTIKQISDITDYKKAGGMYNRQVVSALQKFGLKTKVCKETPWETLKESNTPDSVVIVSWMLDGYIGHVSVVEKVDQKYIYLAEPTTGKILRIEKFKFLRLWLDYEEQEEVPMYPESKSDIQLRWMVIVTK